MKVLDVISEGLGSYFVKKAVIEQIAKGWVKEIKLYKQEFGVIPKLDDLMDFASAEKLTAEKAIARDPKVQAEAYKDAVKLFKEAERANLWKLAGDGIKIVSKKFGTLGSWLTWMAKWGAATWAVVGSIKPYQEYKDKQDYAVSMLAKGPENGGWTPEQFSTYHDRIYIVFMAQEGEAILTAIAAGGLAAWIGRIPMFGAREPLRHIISTLGSVAMIKLQDNIISSPENGKRLAYYLTASGMKDDSIAMPNDMIGQVVENSLLFLAEPWFKKLAFDAAKAAKQGDKIPPNLRPKDDNATDTPALAAPATAPAAANNQDETEPPVSGRTQQGAQPAPAGTVIDWSELSKEGK